MWGLPSRRSGLKAGGMVWYGEYVRTYIQHVCKTCQRCVEDVLKAVGSVLVLCSSPHFCIAVIVQ